MQYNRPAMSFIGAQRKFFDLGGFTRPNPLQPVGRTWYVNGNATATQSATRKGSDSNSGLSWDAPFLTMARAFTFIDSLDIIIVTGVIAEQLSAPVGVFDVSIIGGANRPRQSTSGGVPTEGGSHWAPPASPTATTSLLLLKEQGWRIENIQFLPHTSSACIEIRRADASGSTAEIDSSHAIIRGCRFVGGTTANGILFKDGGYNCVIEDNEFETLTGTAILSSGTSIQVPTNNKIIGNRFSGCTHAIAISSTNGRVIGNIIKQAINGTDNKVNLVSVSGQGELNVVMDNVFPDAAANVTIAKGYKPGTNDIWRNFVTDTAAYIVTVPA